MAREMVDDEIADDGIIKPPVAAGDECEINRDRERRPGAHSVRGVASQATIRSIPARRPSRRKPT